MAIAAVRSSESILRRSTMIERSTPVSTVVDWRHCGSLLFDSSLYCFRRGRRWWCSAPLVFDGSPPSSPCRSMSTVLSCRMVDASFIPVPAVVVSIVVACQIDHGVVGVVVCFLIPFVRGRWVHTLLAIDLTCTAT